MQREDFSNKVLIYSDSMYRFALTYMKSTEEAKDLVQDVLLKLWETRDQLRDIRNIEAWCMTMIRNRSLDRLKQSGYKLKTQLETEHNELRRSESPLKVVTDKESVQNIRKYMKDLPEKQRAVFILRDMQGLSYVEIAEAMNIDMNSVKVNIYRARQALKKNLEKLYCNDL